MLFLFACTCKLTPTYAHHKPPSVIAASERILFLLGRWQHWITKKMQGRQASPVHPMIRTNKSIYKCIHILCRRYGQKREVIAWLKSRWFLFCAISNGKRKRNGIEWGFVKRFITHYAEMLYQLPTSLWLFMETKRATEWKFHLSCDAWYWIHRNEKWK